MKKIIFRLFVIIILIALIFCGFYAYQGYKVYQDVIEEKNIEQRVAELQNKEDYVKLDEIADVYVELVVESEDHRFYQHHGVDYIGLTRAMLTNLATWSYKEGGSTITQQLAKNLCLSFEKSLDRKFAEVFIAWQLERDYSKDEILEMYLNITYLGEGNYGIKAASNYYYNVEPSQLTKEQAEVLVRTLKSPSVYNPSIINE
ncbi:glycosyl transferase [Erysipelatoclostridium sp. An173]|uniref:biosynthetic peptidoglycan transglycosylase n=1 Tax=unclassified Thomasclavelia TaxID=3025756 RepID=UPI000B3685D6|nr:MULTISPECIES: biosynthetic peptidoglycan transglycosylase [unclassified Thomasclavelia]OUP77354.1 glycosyl transferase [Erysipelatoclostridium sp. An173]